MKHKKHTFRSKILRGVLALLVSVSSLNLYAQDNPTPAAPIYETEQYFCAAEVWAEIGEDADYLGDLPIYALQTDYVLTWYKDVELNDKVSDPKAELLADGNTYYVTQTDADGNESEALKIIASETDCGCIKDPGFEDQNGEPTARGYDFYRFDGVSNHKTCGQSMEGALSVTLGAIDGYAEQDNITLVTSGKDPAISDIDRTNINNPLSTHALRINRGVSGGDGTENISSMSKEFIAGEVFSFSFSLALENPDHAHDEQPFGQVNLYDMEDNLIQSRCLVSDPNDCIFKKIEGSGDFVTVLYSEWSCMKLNTANYIGQPLRAEFITAYCTPTVHFSFMYIDDLYAGVDSDEVCSSPAFGYAEVNSVSQVNDYCFINASEVEGDYCDASGQFSNIPGFPIYVCGVYDAPISNSNPAVLDEITLNIIQNNVVVGTISAPEEGTSPNTFCFMVDETDLDVLPYGDFTFSVEADFALDCGSPYNFNIDDNATYGFCPSAGCPDMLMACDIDGSGTATFDLTDHGDIFSATQWTADDVSLTYYTSEDNAFNEVNAIEDPENFQNDEAYNQTIYVRLDWNVSDAPSDCHYLMALDLTVNHIPYYEEWEDTVVYCSGEEIDYPIVATPDNVTDLSLISYKWYKDEVQLPYSGSIYHANQPGEYKVIVSEENCEVSKTVIIEEVGLSIDLGDSGIDVCIDGATASYTIVPEVKSAGETEVNLEEVSYLWNTGDTTKDLTVFESGTYTLEATYGECTYIETKSIFLSERAELAPLDNFTLCKGDSETVELDINHPDTSKLHIEWFRDGGLVAENVEKLEITEAGVYKVVVGDRVVEDCGDDVTFTVDYYDNENCIIPEGLSPNNDGYNDNLDLKYLHDKFGLQSLQVFNRHGVKVYSKDNYINEWYGQSKDNKTLPVGVYYYIIKLKDGSEDITGNIYLNY